MSATSASRCSLIAVEPTLSLVPYSIETKVGRLVRTSCNRLSGTRRVVASSVFEDTQ